MELLFNIDLPNHKRYFSKKGDKKDKIFNKIYIPTVVYNEIVQQNKYSNELRDFSISRIKQIQNQLAVQILQKELDIGESEAIVLAIEKSIANIKRI